MEARPPLDPLLHDQLSSMGQEISHLLLRAGPPKDFELRTTVEKESKRRIAFLDELRPKMKVDAVPRSPQAVTEATICSRCHVLNMQVRALAQSLAGLGAKAFNWSTGLSKLQRRDLAEVVLEYCRPCGHLDTTLEGLCIDLENIHWGDVAAVGSVAQQAPPADWMSQAKQKVVMEAPPAPAEAEPAKELDAVELGVGDTGAAPSGAASQSSQPSEDHVEQRLQEILQQGQQQRLDVGSLQELQRLLSTVASRRDASPHDGSPSPSSGPRRSSSPRPGTQQPWPERHGLPLLVPRQQELPPRHPPSLQAPPTQPALGPGTPRALVQRAVGREAKTCRDLLGDVKPAGDPLPGPGVTGEPDGWSGDVGVGAPPADLQPQRLSGMVPADVPRISDVSGAPAEVSFQRLSGVPPADAQRTSQVPGLQPAGERQRLSGMPAEVSSQRLSGVPPADLPPQRPSAQLGVPAADAQRTSQVPGLQPAGERQRLSGMPAEVSSQRLSGVPPADLPPQRQSGLPAQGLSKPGGVPSDSGAQTSVGAVAGSFEISPAAASTQQAETTPGGASPDEDWEERSEHWQRPSGQEATLSAPQISVQPAPEVPRQSSGLSERPKAAAAAATKKASRFTFMGLGRRK